MELINKYIVNVIEILTQLNCIPVKLDYRNG